MAAGLAVMPISYAAEPVSENRTWDFSAFAGDAAVTPSGEETVDYNGLELHINSGDTVSDSGLIWSAPGTTTSDNKTVANNRYIVITPATAGTVSVTFSGSRYDSASKAPRMYMVTGAMSKTNGDAEKMSATAKAANAATTLTAEVDGGKTYYIWPYYYNNSSVSFTVTGVEYAAAVPEMKTRNIYESNMLLQRNEPIYIDGTCSAAVTEATVALVNENTDEVVETVDADIDGREWNATLGAVSDYENTYKLIISSDGMEDIVYTNIIFGDQYIFSGQSNMWMRVSDYASIDKDAYSQSAVTPHLTDKIRLMYTPGQSDYGTNVLQFDAQNKNAWRDFSTYANIKDVGAPAFTAAIKLHEETGVPIGVIDNAYPGSYISSWFDSALAIDACNTGRNKTSNERNWYCGRIYPLRNLKLSGIFWYQGCADAATTYHDQPYEYYMEMMPRLISSWRELFNDADLPFYYTQLSRIGSTIVDENNPDTGSAGKMPIKLAQTDTYLNMADKTNVGLVSTLDLYGNHNAEGTRNCRTDIHLAQKQFVGDRMARLALYDIYGKDVYRMGPLYKSSKAVGDKVIVTFECNGKLSIMPSSQYTDTVGEQKIADGEFDPSVLNEFELAGEDGVWYAANAEITGDDEVTVTSQNVTAPVKVRYCGSDYPESPNLTDESGLPSYVFSKDIEEISAPEATAAPESKKITKITADYDETGRMINILTEQIDITDMTKPENTPTHKVFYWNNLDEMVPIALPTSVPEPTQPASEPTNAPEPEATQAPEDIESVQYYSFGNALAGASGDSHRVTADTAYGEYADGTYGLIDVSEESKLNDFRFDGFSDDVLTYPVNGDGYIAADYSRYSDDVLSTFGDGIIPIRFAAKGETGAYYTVTATVINTSETENTEVTLFGENRYMILYNRTLAPGESKTCSWNVRLVGQYYNSTGAYTDDAINVAAAGKNVGLSSVKIEKHKAIGKTIWLMTDSTGDNSSAALPYFGLRGKCGVGQVLTKYLNPNIAVNNQGEGGLTSADNKHLNNALPYMQAGDWIYVQYGFNGETTSSLTKNLDKYYNAAHERGAKLVVVSTTERQSSQFWDPASYSWLGSNAAMAAAGKTYVEAKLAEGAEDIAFVDLNTAMIAWMTEETANIKAQRNRLGFGDTAPSRLAMNYYFGFDRDSGVDSIHINDAGADNAAYLVYTEMTRSDGVQMDVLAELIQNARDNAPYTVSDEIVKKGWVPNDSYPYPLPSDVTYEYPTIVKSIDISDSAVNSVKVMVQGNMAKYAIAAVDILDADGNVIKTVYSRSTDINPLIDHIDNTACKYGDVYTMYFDTNETAITSEDSVRAYMVAIETGGMPTDEKYASYYYYYEPDSVLLSEDFSDGISGWNQGGSSAVKETAAVQKDGKAAIKLMTNGSGTYNVYKRFNSNAEASNGTVKLRFMINYVYGNFTLKLTPATATGSYISGAKNLNIIDGAVQFEDGTEIGRLKTGKWTDIELDIDFVKGTETAAVAGGTPQEIVIDALRSENADDVSNYAPIRGFAVAYMATGSTIPSYSFETYLSDVTVEAIETDLPAYTITAAAAEGCDGMGTVTGGGEYPVNAAAEIKARANDGYEFTGWYDGNGKLISKSSTYSVRVRSDKTMYARFAEAVSDPNLIKWRFSAFDGAAAVSGKADTAYNGLTIHTNSNDSITVNGLYWSAPGGTKSDSTTVVSNNRYIEFVPDRDGTISITYSGSKIGSNWPRMYISCGDSTACMTKDANANQLAPNITYDNKAGADKEATMTAELTAGNHYYIWAYYYNQTGAHFNISAMQYDMANY